MTVTVNLIGSGVSERVPRAQAHTCRSLENEALRLGRKDRQGPLHRSPRHDRLCLGRLGFACASCTEVVVCAGQEAFLSTCATDMRAQEKDQLPKTFYCNNMHIFDPETLTCKAVPDVPACFATGVFPVEHACRWYYSCMPTGASKWYQDYYLCPENKVYSQAMAVCVDPQSLPEGTPCSSKRSKRLLSQDDLRASYCRRNDSGKPLPCPARIDHLTERGREGVGYLYLVTMLW
ncbi:hypothetical protein O3P69_002345 [Scylla paramamosain]|uniref:Chitin-binding type-2 domain-containing protein n=1 Tax=Scylla paramamosain TaxID=85552 RepID=A0AAW0V5W4_SCYPA